MIVTCKTFDDFMVNLNSISNDRLVEKTLRVSISELDESGTGTRFIINFQASAVVDFKSLEGQYLLELGVVTGRDIRDAEPELTGTEKALEYKTILSELCKVRGWSMLPGIISI